MCVLFYMGPHTLFFSIHTILNQSLITLFNLPTFQFPSNFKLQTNVSTNINICFGQNYLSNLILCFGQNLILCFGHGFLFPSLSYI